MPVFRRGRHRALTAGIALRIACWTVVVGLAVAAAVAANAGASSTPAPPQLYVVGQNVSDAMNRTVTAGFGSADAGGSYQTSDSPRYSVTPGAAHISPLTPGGSARATLVSISARDERLQAVVAVTSLPTRSRGMYVSLEFRRQANGNSYRARLHVLPNGATTLQFAQFIGGVETAVGTPAALGGTLAAGEPIAIQADVDGSSPVFAEARAWPVGTSEPAWLVKHTFLDAAIRTAGNVGLAAFLTPGSAPTGLTVTSVKGWALSTSPGGGGSTSLTNPGTGVSLGQANETGGVAASHGAGSATPGQTDYAVPSSHVLFVSPTGSDYSSGTVSKPLRTVAHAIAVASSGSTIVLRAGSYNESVTIPPSKRLTLESYPHEAVWFEGAPVLTGWVHSGTTWVHSGWTKEFDSTPGYSAAAASGYSWINPAYPMAAHPDQMYLNGSPLTQVSSASAVKAGTFFADYKNKRLVIGSNPSGQEIRASNLATALAVYSPGSVLRGFGVRRYATPVDAIGTVRLEGTGDLMTNVVVTDNATQGLSAGASGVLIDHVTSQYNGLLGMHANHADNLTIQHSLVDSNNAQHFNTSPVAGGIKITQSRNLTVRDNVVEYNNGSGLWFDESCYNMTATGNTLDANSRMGLSVELSAVGVYANNEMRMNAFDGLRIVDTSSIKVWNNSISANNSRNIEVVQDTRKNTPGAPGHDPRRPNPDPTIPWVTSQIQIVDNVFVGGGQFHVWVFDYTGARSATAMKVTVDGNEFSAPPREGYAPIGWGTNTKKIIRYYTPAQFTHATGQGSYNVMRSSKNSTTLASTASPSSAVPLPSAVADVLGLAVGTRHRGDF